MSKAPPPPEKENHERWVISYADLVTLLLGFFIILYATADVNAVKFATLSHSIARAFNVEVKQGVNGSTVLDGGSGITPNALDSSAIDRQLEAIRSALEQRSQDLGVSLGKIAVTRDQQNIIIRLSDELLFASASADVRGDALSLLQVVGQVVAKLPNEIRVEGHTDNVPVATDRYPTNWELSSARATAVLRYLVEHVGVDPARAFAAGYGEYRPTASNLTPEGRALNRRADIVVLYPASKIPERQVGPLDAPGATPATPSPAGRSDSRAPSQTGQE